MRVCVFVCEPVWLSLCAAYENSVAQRSTWCTQKKKTKTAHKSQLVFHLAAFIPIPIKKKM